MHFTVDISNNIVAGVLAGALTGLVIVLLVSLIAAGMDSMMSLGGSGDYWRKVLYGGVRIIPLCIAMGGITAISLPWWSVPLVIFGCLLFINLLFKKSRRH